MTMNVFGDRDAAVEDSPALVPPASRSARHAGGETWEREREREK